MAPWPRISRGTEITVPIVPGLVIINGTNPGLHRGRPTRYFREQEQARLRGEEDRGRADDTEDVILNRMKVYRDETAPLLDYYNAELKTVDAVGTVDEAFARALRALGK